MAVSSRDGMGLSPPTAPSFQAGSISFPDGGRMAPRHGGNDPRLADCVGGNVSPKIHWSHAPPVTQSFAILVIDPEANAPEGIAYGIKPSISRFAEGEVSRQTGDFIGGTSMMGMSFYNSPCPAAQDGTHHYTFLVMATDLAPDTLAPGLPRDAFNAALKGHVLATAGFVGLYEKPST